MARAFIISSRKAHPLSPRDEAFSSRESTFMSAIIYFESSKIFCAFYIDTLAFIKERKRSYS